MGSCEEHEDSPKTSADGRATTGNERIGEGRSAEAASPIPTRPTPQPPRWASPLCALVIALAAIAVYHNSLAVPFILDDLTSIPENPTIVRLWPVWEILSPPNGATVSGRPLLNLSLAVNYAISGLNVWSYHAVNILIHILAALTLLGILRRTFLLPALKERFGSAALALSLAAALIWTVHPLQTESVTYVIQRAESLVGLFYLLTLYCVIRGAHSPRGIAWYAAAFVTCLMGMATKEVMVTAPLAVLLYDRMFLAGSLREALRARWRVYLAMAATWGLLAYLVISTGSRGGTAGFGLHTEQMNWWVYAQSQCGVIVRYLRLSFWPGPLVLYYNAQPAHAAGQIVPWAMVIGLLMLATAIAWRKRYAVGFLGVWFFLVLAPTSSVVPVADLIFEHRMYLPLAAVAVLAVTGAWWLWEALLMEAGISSLAARAIAPMVVAIAVTTALGSATVMRNRDYRSDLSIWEDTVNKRPGSPRAHYNFGYALASAGRTEDAIQHYRYALSIDPSFAEAHNNLGSALLKAGKKEDALRQFREALRLNPDLAEAHYNLGNVLAGEGKTADAIKSYEQALQLKPDYVKAHNNLAATLVDAGRPQEAIAHYERAIRIKPDCVEAMNNLGTALVTQGKMREAIGQYEKALWLKPDSAELHYKLADLLVWAGRTHDAIAHYDRAIALQADYVDAINNLAWLLATREPNRGGNPARAIALAEQGCRLTGNKAGSFLDTMAAAYAAAGRFPEAIATAERVIEMATAAGRPDLAKPTEGRLKLYRNNRPYREPARPTNTAP